MIKNFSRRKARINLNAERLRLFAEPTAEIAEADNIITFIVHCRRQAQARHATGTRFGQKHYFFSRDRCIKRCSFVLPIWNELAQGPGFEHRAGHDMSADFRAFLDYIDTEF